LKEERDPQLVDVNSLLEAFIMKHVDMKATCDVAHSYGMRFPGDTTPQPTHDVGGGGKRLYDAGQKSQNHDKKLKGDGGNDKICQHCGVIGHLKAQCRKIKDTSKYFNCLNVPYEDSEAWKRVQKDVKDAIKTLEYPRVPTHESVFLAANTKYGAPNPKTGIPPKNLNHFHLFGNQCSNCNTVGDECVALMSNHIATFLNYTEIVIPTSRPKRQQETMGQEKRVDGSVAHDKVPTMALIDTGAINGNYVGNWIVKYNVNI
jgi:hypothetical protein